jgi:AraC-like DNA-binding protein
MAAKPSQTTVEKMAESPLFRQFQQAFEVVTALPLTLRAVESRPLAQIENRNQNHCCSLLSQTHGSCALCLKSQTLARTGVKDVPGAQVCALGLKETAVGVKVGKEIVAYLQTGQMFFKTPTREQTEHTLQQIREWGPDLEPGEAIRRYRATPVVHRRQYQAGVKLLQVFAQQLGSSANQIVLVQANAEPAQITHARELIAAQYMNEVTLTMIAKRVGMNRFSFSKRFKQATGANYTDFVSRVRLEKAKNLLLNPQFRVSEIAFEVGFRSLTHFNRVFKRIAGESPTEYRQHLQGA